MFAIQPSNRLYKDKRYVGIRKDTGLPYLIYEGNPDYPKDIYGFATKQEALVYLNKIIYREDINVSELTTSQIVDLTLVNDADKFYVVDYEIADNTMCVHTTELQDEFTRKGWY